MLSIELSELSESKISEKFSKTDLGIIIRSELTSCDSSIVPKNNL